MVIYRPIDRQTEATYSGSHKENELRMMRLKLFFVTVLALALAFTGLAFAQKKPVQNVSAKRHPNLSEAQRLSSQAFGKIVAAQKANEWDMQGHAQKAKELLDQANQELKQAAEAANANH
jgi:F0F1-type ATP synthase membrane subunit b/b'